MTELSHPREREVARRGDGVPGVVHVFARGVPVVDPVVAENPGLEEVESREHHHTTEHAVRARAREQRAVRSVVPEHAERDDGERREDPQRNEQPGRVDEDERCRGRGVHRQVTDRRDDALAPVALVAAGRQAGDHVGQGVLPLALLAFPPPRSGKNIGGPLPPVIR